MGQGGLARQIVLWVLRIVLTAIGANALVGHPAVDALAEAAVAVGGLLLQWWLSTRRRPSQEGSPPPAAMMALAVLLLAASARAQSVIYVDASYGGTETGAEATPFNTLAEAQSAATSGSTIYLVGTGTTPTYGAKVYRDVGGSSRSWISTGKQVVIDTKPGTGRARISGAVAVLSSQLVNVASDVWYFEVTDASVVQGVTFNYYTTIKPSAPCAGSFGGWVREINTGVDATDITSVTSTATTWCPNPAATPDRVYFNLPGSGTTPPADYVVEWVRDGDYNAINIQTSTGSVVRNIDFDRVNSRETNGSDGASVVLENSTGGLLENLATQDCGDKAYALSAQSGNVNTGNVVRNCTASGTGARDPDTINAVFFTASTNDVTGGRAYGCTAQARGLYTPTFGVLAPRPAAVWASGSAGQYGSAVKGFSAHSATAGTQHIADVEFNTCSVEVDPQFWFQAGTAGYTGSPLDFSISGTRGLTGSPYEVSSYPARIVRCSTSKGMGWYLSEKTAVAFDRCRLYHDAGVTNNQYRYNASSLGAFGFGTAATDSTFLLSGCDVTFDLKAATAYALITLGNISSISAPNRGFIIKSTIRDLSVTGGVTCAMLNWPNAASTNCTLEVAQSALIAVSGSVAGDMTIDNNRWLMTSPWAPAADLARGSFRLWGNLYYGFNTSNRFFVSTGLTSAASFASTSAALGVDPLAVTGTDPLLESPLTSPVPQPGSPLRVRRHMGVLRRIPGLNGLGGSNIGCIQNGDDGELTRSWSR